MRGPVRMVVDMEVPALRELVARSWATAEPFTVTATGDDRWAPGPLTVRLYHRVVRTRGDGTDVVEAFTREDRLVRLVVPRPGGDGTARAYLELFLPSAQSGGRSS